MAISSRRRSRAASLPVTASESVFTATDLRALIKEAIREHVANHAQTSEAIALPSTIQAVPSGVKSESALRAIGLRLQWQKDRLISACGSLSVSLERLTGRMITPSQNTPVAGAAPAMGDVARLHETIDEIVSYLLMLDEVAAAVNEL